MTNTSLPTISEPTTASSLWFTGVCIVGILVMLTPFFLADIPAMLDYPNHITRMSIITRWLNGEESAAYEVQWRLISNLAMDIAVPWLAGFIGIEAATKIFTIAAFVTIVTGVMMLERAISNSVGPAGLIAAMLLYNKIFVLGFINFAFGVGITIWGLVAWITVRNQKLWIRIAVHTGFVMVLFISHLHALGIYGAALAAYELWHWIDHRVGLRAVAMDGAVVVAPVALCAALLVMGGTAAGDVSHNVWMLRTKLTGIIMLMNGYDQTLAVGEFVVLVVLVGTLIWRRNLSMHPVGFWIAGTFCLIYIAMPFILLHSSFADIRLAAAVAMILPAFLTWHPSVRQAKLWIGLAVVAVMLTNVAYVSRLWMDAQKDYREMIEVFRTLPRGATMLVGTSGTVELWLLHAPTMAVRYADAFVPTFFTHPGMQVVKVRQEFSDMDVPDGWPVPETTLLAAARGKLFDGDGYLKDWPNRFDYLFFFTETSKNPLPNRLHPVAIGRKFALYRIDAEGK